MDTNPRTMDPIYAFTLATAYYFDGDFAGALPYLNRAATVMGGDPEFDALHAKAKANA